MGNWKPRYDEYYWYIDNVGHLHYSNWYGLLIDTYRFEIGNVFKTKDEAIHESEHRKVLAELKQFSCKFNSNNKNYYIYYNHKFKNIITSFDTYKQRNEIYFESYEKVDKAIEQVGEERILKYYLGIKEN